MRTTVAPSFANIYQGTYSPESASVVYSKENTAQLSDLITRVAFPAARAQASMFARVHPFQRESNA
jgi:hypothetical protein